MHMQVFDRFAEVKREEFKVFNMPPLLEDYDVKWCIIEYDSHAGQCMYCARLTYIYFLVYFNILMFVSSMSICNL